jgi:hypothetical protein
MLRRILKIIGWIAGGTLGLGVALYLIAVAINWHDRPPSAAAVQFMNLYRERPTVADEDNAFIYAMGFAVGPGANPQWRKEFARQLCVLGVPAKATRRTVRRNMTKLTGIYRPISRPSCPVSRHIEKRARYHVRVR